MKNLMFAVLALFLVGATCPNEVYAQKKKKEKQENVQEKIVLPKFRGGTPQKEFTSWLYYRIQDKWKTHTDYKGKVVISFVVGADGKVSEFKLKKGTGIIELDNMLRDIMLSCPEWTPKKINGVPVEHTYTSPVTLDGTWISSFGKQNNVGRTNPNVQYVRGWQR